MLRGCLVVVLVLVCISSVHSTCPQVPASFRGLGDQVWPGTGYTWYFNFDCQVVHAPHAGCEATSVGQVDENQGKCYATASTTGTWAIVDTNHVTLTFTKGNYHDHSASFSFICDAQTQGLGTPPENSPKVTDKDYGFVDWKTEFACNANFGGGSSSPKDEDKGLSGGWIFVIILCVCVPAYVVAGCTWNYKRNGTSLGMESCPNREFWAGFLGFVKDGIVFTFTCGRRSYEKV